MYREFYEPFLGQDAQGEPSTSGFVTVHCPFKSNHTHGDKRASAGFNPKTGVFNCYGCGSMSPEKFLEAITGVGPQEAHSILQQYRQEHKLVDHQDTFVNYLNPSPKFEVLAAKARSQLDPNLPIVREYMEARDFDFDVLKDLGIGYLDGEDTHRKWGRDCLVFPYEFDGKVVGIRYRDAEGSKGGEIGCHFTLWGIDTLDQPGLRAAVIVEGESDRIAAFQAVRYAGLEKTVTALSTPTATFRQEWKREFQNVRKAIMIPQDDEASLKMVEKARTALGEKLEIHRLPWKRKQYGNDICDWRRYHSVEDLAGVITQAVGDVDRTILTGHEFKEVANKPRKWVIKGLLARRQVCVIAGKPKAYKTWLMMTMIRTLLTPGSFFLGIPELESTNLAARILIIEEEGDIEELYQRAEKTLDGTDWEERTFWAHHLGFRFDEDTVVERVSGYINTYNIDTIFIDPFSRMYSVDENSSSEMGIVWGNIHKLTSRFPFLNIIVLHHFGKAGVISEGFDAFRGSSRSAQEADLGIFVEKRSASEPEGTKIRFEGRSIPRIVGADGKDVFKLAFDQDTGLLNLDLSKGPKPEKWMRFADDLEEHGTWEVADAAVHYAVTTITVKTWAEKAKKVIDLEYRHPAPGQPGYFKFLGRKEK